MIYNIKDYDQEVKKFNYIQSGMVSTVHVAPNSYSEVEVYFNTTFNSVPSVVACIDSASTSLEYSKLTLVVRGITTRGFIIRVFAGDSSVTLSPSVRWIAVKVN